MKKTAAVLLCLCCFLTAGGATNALAQEAAVDIDLTQMSATMVYAYVFNLMTTPEEYIGQRYRIAGVHGSSYFEETDATYHYIVIEDATACCAEGLEFVLADEAADYPQPGDVVELSGVLEPYMENGVVYVHIVAEQMTVLYSAEQGGA